MCVCVFYVYVDGWMDRWDFYVTAPGSSPSRILQGFVVIVAAKRDWICCRNSQKLQFKLWWLSFFSIPWGKFQKVVIPPGSCKSLLWLFTIFGEFLQQIGSERVIVNRLGSQGPLGTNASYKTQQEPTHSGGRQLFFLTLSSNTMFSNAPEWGKKTYRKKSTEN